MAPGQPRKPVIYREGYFKVSRRLLDSSLWCEPGEVIKVFLALLERSQDPSGPRDGTVFIARPLLASKCLMDDATLEKALAILSRPDPQSRTVSDDGRRIEVLPNGYRILNYKLYHDRSKDEATSKARSRAGKVGGKRSGEVRKNQLNRHKQNGSKDEANEANGDGDGDKTETEKQKTTLSPVGDLVAFYNRITHRNLTPAVHAKFVAPRIKDGVRLTTLKLAVLGACLSAFHLGGNDRQKEYLDPETILRPGRIDGHAERARTATFRLERAAEVWGYWSPRLDLSESETMEHFFRSRDELLVEEGRKPIGPVAVYAQGYRLGDPWPEKGAE